MNDRELLEAAALAEGRSLGAWWEASSASYNKRYAGYGCPGPNVTWNPLTDDGDALRLASTLNMDVCINICFCEVVWVNMDTSETFEFTEDWGARDVELTERMAHVRRAIVRAAAAIGGAK